MKLRPFELGLVITFVIMAMFALIIMATYKTKPSTKNNEVVAVGSVTIWGTLPASAINPVLNELKESNDAYRGVRYVYYSPDEFDSKLTSGLADNEGPDLILTSHEKVVNLRKRVQTISYESYPVRDLRNNFIDGAEIFALRDGLYGLPLAVDPLMMFWNKDILSTEGYLEAPKTWEAIVNDVLPNLIQRDFNRTIRRSVIAMGEYNNIENAFGILSTLIIQGGSKLVRESDRDDYLIQLQSSETGVGQPFSSAVDFYTRFSKPNNTLYSWNRSLANDKLNFLAEDLVFYFGYGSESRQIEKANPNLNFDIAEMPQGSGAVLRRTYGKFYALSILKSSDNQRGATSVLSDLVGREIAEKIAISAGMAPVYRASLNAGSNDIYGRIIFESAPITYGWLNPDLSATNRIFSSMTMDINENRNSASGATGVAVSLLSEEY
jgi:ABC-type glycerol-3-phosphate transport system substrate-binding protein